MLEGAGSPRFAMISYDEEIARLYRGRLLFPVPAEELDVIIHLTPDEVDKKEACLRLHEAIITMREDGDPSLLRRPPREKYDLLAEEIDPPADDLFAGLAGCG